MGAQEQSLVLLLDDDELLARSLRRALERRGFRVVATHDLESALAAADRCIPDVCVVDYRLGGSETGADFAREMWERCGKQTPPLVLLSGTLQDVPIADRRPFVAAHDKSLAIEAIVHELREAMAHGHELTRSHSRLRAMPRPEADLGAELMKRKRYETP